MSIRATPVGRHLALVFTAAAAAAWAMVSAGATVSDAAQGARVATPPRDLEGRLFDGPPETSIVDGQAYFLEFSEPWCGPCRASVPKLVELKKRYPKLHCVILSTASSTKMADLEKFAQVTRDTGVTILRSPNLSQFFNECGFRGYPSALLVGTNGKIVWTGHPDQCKDGDVDSALGVGKKAAEPALDALVPASTALAAAVEGELIAGPAVKGVEPGKAHLIVYCRGTPSDAEKVKGYIQVRDRLLKGWNRELPELRTVVVGVGFKNSEEARRFEFDELSDLRGFTFLMSQKGVETFASLGAKGCPGGLLVNQSGQIVHKWGDEASSRPDSAALAESILLAVGGADEVTRFKLLKRLDDHPNEWKRGGVDDSAETARWASFRAWIEQHPEDCEFRAKLAIARFIAGQDGTPDLSSIMDQCKESRMLPLVAYAALAGRSLKFDWWLYGSEQKGADYFGTPGILGRAHWEPSQFAREVDDCVSVPCDESLPLARIRKAHRIASAAVQLDPNDSTALFVLALAEYRCGSLQIAIAKLQLAIDAMQIDQRPKDAQRFTPISSMSSYPAHMQRLLHKWKKKAEFTGYRLEPGTQP